MTKFKVGDVVLVDAAWRRAVAWPSRRGVVVLIDGVWFGVRHVTSHGKNVVHRFIENQLKPDPSGSSEKTK